MNYSSDGILSVTLKIEAAMKNKNLHNFLDLLHKTHVAEWEATPSIQEAVQWLNELIEFLFPTNNHLNKPSIYEGILKKIRSIWKIFFSAIWMPTTLTLKKQ